MLRLLLCLQRLFLPTLLHGSCCCYAVAVFVSVDPRVQFDTEVVVAVASVVVAALVFNVFAVVVVVNK